jgi:hypothetical protein
MKHLKINIILIFIILIILGTGLSACKKSITLKELSGLYVSFSDIRAMMISSLDKEEKEKLDTVLEVNKGFTTKPMYMYGYNFTFLYINEEGKFYHYFKAKDNLSQETTGKVKIVGNKIHFSGDTLIEQKNKEPVTVPFKASMKVDNPKTDKNITLLITHLNAEQDKYRLYASLGYEKIDKPDDILFLNFDLVESYYKNVASKEFVKKDFPQINQLFREAVSNIDGWKALDMKTAFYIPKNGIYNGFIFIDAELERLIYYEKDKMIYDGKYSFDGKNIVTMNLDVRDYLPFIVEPDFENNKIDAFVNLEGRVFEYYPNMDYIKKMKDIFVRPLFEYPIFTSKKLRELIDEVKVKLEKEKKEIP